MADLQHLDLQDLQSKDVIGKIEAREERSVMKRLLSIILVCCMCFVLTGCGPEYEDTNGEDNFKLQSITDDDIINLATGASGLTYKEQNIAGLHSSEYSSKNFNGVEQLYLTSFIAKSDVEIYIGHMSVESGNFKLVVINNEKIIREIPLDTFNKSFYFEDLEGDFSVHVAGESAKFDFHIDIL